MKPQNLIITCVTVIVMSCIFFGNTDPYDIAIPAITGLVGHLTAEKSL